MSRGRNAETPLEIPAPGWKDIAIRTVKSLGPDHVGLIAAGVAFYALLALFPAIGAAVAIAGLIAEPAMLVDQIESFRSVLPQEVTQIILDQATAVAGSREGGLGLAAIFGLLLALYSSSKGMASLMEGLNVAYGETEDRGFFMLTLVKLSLTILAIVGVVVAASVSVVIPAVLAVIGLGADTETLISAISWAAMLVLAVLGLAVIYRFGPSRRAPKWRWITPGATVAVVLWLIGSAAFAFYVSNFGSYNETFGTLAGVIVLLMWLWLSAYIVLLGAEVDAELEAQTKVDTTVGQDRPKGERGAASADRLGQAHG